MNKNTFFEYFKTIILTIILATILVFITLGVIQHQVYTELSRNNIKSDAIDYYLVNVLIEKNKYIEKQKPENYKINFRLGMLYEVKSDFTNAENEYKKAIHKAPIYEYLPKYKLALLYIRLNRLDDAESIIENIEDRSDKKLIGYKIDIYYKLGDKYYNKADYETAEEEYTTALFYAKKINSHQTPAIKAGLASSYIYYAEDKVAHMQIDEAINSLQQALTVVNAPIIKYKLAVLLRDSNPTLSLKYCTEVFNEEPSIINYDWYYQFLSKLSINAELQGDIAESELYRFKIKKLKNYYKNNILSVEDVAILEPRGKIKLNKWSKKYNIDFDFRLKNVSKYNINSLFVEIVFKDGNKVIGDYLKQIVDQKSELKAGSEGITVNINTTKIQTLEDKSPKTITVEVYATKKEDSYKIFLKQFHIVEKVKAKRNHKPFH